MVLGNIRNYLVKDRTPFVTVKPGTKYDVILNRNTFYLTLLVESRKTRYPVVETVKLFPIFEES